MNTSQRMTTRRTATLLGVDDARERLLTGLRRPSLGHEEVPLAAALGRIAADDITADLAVPPWRHAALDGFVVRAEDIAAGAALLPLRESVRGVLSAPHEPGAAAHISTGAPIPAGADTVVPLEQCTVEDDHIRINGRPAAGSNVRDAGADIRYGARFIRAGQRLRPQDIGLAAAAGLARVCVRRMLKVAILTAGDELAAPGTPLGPSQIYDANGPLLAALITQLGAVPGAITRVPDTVAATAGALANAAEHADLIITTGGVAPGADEYVHAAIDAIGHVALWRVALTPGKALAVGHVGATPYIGLPGNPVSLFMTFLLFAAPAIRYLQGRLDIVPSALPVPAGFDVTRSALRDEYVRVRLEDGRLRRFPKQGAGMLTSTAWADGFAIVPAGHSVTAGDPLNYLPLSLMLC
jgi:molybdopterin molybdotransferase